MGSLPQTRWTGERLSRQAAQDSRNFATRGSVRLLFGAPFKMVWTSACYIGTLRRRDPDLYGPRPVPGPIRVDPLVMLDLQHSIPIDDDEIWPRLSLTRGMEKRAAHWAQAANLRASLRELPKDDGELLATLLNRQNTEPRLHSLTAADERRLAQRQSVRTPDRVVVVEVPSKEDVSEPEAAQRAADEPARESYQIQAILARIGAEMGFRIWIPRGDRHQIALLLAEDARSNLITDLPLNYDDTNSEDYRANRRNLDAE